MRFTRVTGENFLSIGKLDQSLEHLGLVMLVGTNLDDPSAESNGSGKSSFIELIVWTLYGLTLRGVKTDTVINRVVGKNCHGYLDLTVEQGRLEIDRYRKHREFKNQLIVRLNGQQVGSTDPRTTQTELTRLLGCGYDHFTRLMVIAQGFDSRYTSMNDRALKEFIEAMTGSLQFSQAHDLIGTDLHDIRGAVSLAEAARIALETEMTNNAVKLTEEQHKAAAAKGIRDQQVQDLSVQRDNAQAALKLIEIKVAEAKAERVALESTQADVMAKWAEQRTILETKHQTELTDLQQEKANLLGRHQVDSSARADVHRLLAIKQTGEIETWREGLGNLELRFAQANYVPDPSSQMAVAALTKTLEDRGAELAAAQNQSCFTCGQPLPAEKVGVILAAAKAKVDETDKELAEAVVLLEEEQRRVGVGERRRSELAIPLANYRAEGAVMGDLHNEVMKTFNAETLVLAEGQAVEMTQVDQKMIPITTRHRQEITDFDAEQGKASQYHQSVLSASDQQLGAVSGETQRLGGIATSAQTQIDGLNAQDLDATVTFIENQIAAARTKLTETIQNEQELGASCSRLEYLDKAFGLKGIRSFMMDNVLVYLNQRLKEHCQYLFDGRTSITMSPIKAKKAGGATEKISMEVSTAGGSYESSSGGERRKVDVALFLAFRDLNRMMSPVQTNLEAYDEILSFLDGESASRVIHLLLADKSVESKIIITHRTDIPMIGAYRTIKAVKHLGVTSYS